jgi:two-component system, LytTR family, response regulator
MSLSASAIIVDDMTSHRETLRKKLELYCPSIRIDAECSTIEEAANAVEKHEPTIVFLDIELGTQNGFDLLKQLDTYSFRVVFVSAHSSEENLLRAIKVSAAGFVTKPIDKDELILAVQKILRDVKEENSVSAVKTLVHNLSTTQPESQMILVSNKTEGEKQLRIGNIVFCESDNTRIHFRLNDLGSFSTTGSLSSYEELLAPYGFYRIQRSYLININYVDRVIRHEKDIIMKCYPSILMSASRDKDLWNHFIEAWERMAIKPH